MKKSILFFLLISGLSFSQQKNLKINFLQPKSENCNFPVVSYADKPTVENKINTFLQVDQLEYIPGSGGNPFKLVSSGKTSYSNYVDFYSWEKRDAPKNILCLAIDGEASGAYPEYFMIWKNFDLRTGNLINIQDLFQPGAVKVVESIIQKRIRKNINDFLTQLKSEKNPSQEVLDQIAIYEGCYTDYTLDGIKYYFTEDKLKFIAGRCANHAMRALDELGEHVIELPYKELDNYWSPYAKNLLNGSPKADKTSFRNKLYKGTIGGKYPVTVLIKDFYDAKEAKGESSFSAWYWYDKSKKLIEWNGKMKGNHISITENDYYSEETNQWIIRAFVEAEMNGNKITGTWQDNKTKNYLTIELEEL